MVSVHQEMRISIGVATTSFPLTRDSASGIFVYRLLQHLPAAVRNTVITPAAQTAPEALIHSDPEIIAFRYAPQRWQVLAHGGGGIPAALSGNRWRYLLLPPFLLSMFIAGLRSTRRLDLIHAHWAINGLVFGLAGKLTRTPVLTTLRGSDVNLAVRSRVHRMILRLCVRLSAKVVTVNDSLMVSARRLNPDIAGDKFCVIPNGVDDTCFSIERHALMAKPVLELITVGNLTANKGVGQILRALHLLPGTPLRLRIVGSGPEQGRLMELTSALGLEPYVEFTGAVAPAHIAQLLAAADIFVFASHSEGRPNALLEAMAAALPIVATDIPGIRDMVTPRINGLLFADNDISRLATHIAELAGNPVLRYELGAAARQFVTTNKLNWNDTAARYYRLYREMLAGRQPIQAQ